MVEDMYVSVKFLFGDGKRKRTQFVQVQELCALLKIMLMKQESQLSVS